jgi:intergrase/recombinase
VRTTDNREVRSSNLRGPIFLFNDSDDKSIISSIQSQKHTYKITFSDDFLDYIEHQGYSENHILHLKSYFNRHLKSKAFQSPLELHKYINLQKAGRNHIAKTARVYLNFAEKSDFLSADVIQKYRSVIKIEKSQPDVYVPSDDEVLSAYNLIKKHKDLELVFLILACSGIRYIETLDFLRNPGKVKHHKSFVSFSVGNNRHTKRLNNIYLPDFVFDKLFLLDCSYNSLRSKFKRAGLKLNLKYLRKWNYNLLLYQGVPESVADFIQGRSNRSISSNHYLAKSQQAEYWYGKIINLLLTHFR